MFAKCNKISFFAKVLKKNAVIHDTGIGHVMRKLNGITINGEYLGNSVVINGMFRAICTISPVIMRDFVQIINKIEKLEEAVKIHNFNCGFDSIDIEFENTNSKGIASLYFKIKNGEPELTDCKLVIDNQVYSTREEKISLKTNKTSPTTPPPLSDAEERRNKIREIRERKLQQLKQNEELRKQQGAPPLAQKRASVPAEMSKSQIPEDPRLRKRQELLEKKRKAMEARANRQAAEGNTDVLSASQESSSGNSVSGYDSKDRDNINKTISENGEVLNTAESLTEKDSKSGIDNIQNKSDSPNNENISGTSAGDVSENGSAAQKSAELNSDGDFNDYSSENEFGDNYDNYDNNDGVSSGVRSLDDISDEDLENMSDEELAALEAELNAELGEDAGYESGSDNYYSDSPYSNQDFSMGGFAEKLSQELAQGLTEGLTQGLTQGLAQGLSQGFSAMPSGQNFGGGGLGGSSGGGFGGASGGGFDFSGQQPQNQQFSGMSIQQLPPDYEGIDNRNMNAAMDAQDSYAYDENSDIDDLSDLYSDFYEENAVQDEDEYQTMQRQGFEPTTSEVDALKAELDALRAETESKKDLMSLDEFLAKQKELQEAKEKKKRQKIRIVGSREKINASALQDGVFVAGNKVYKWGDTRVLDQ